jgi:hypothetical protein
MIYSYADLFFFSYILSSGLCFFVDIFLPKYRVNYCTQDKVVAEYKNMLPLCALNSGLGYIYLDLMEYYFTDKENYNDNNLIENFLLWSVLTDFVFYLTHRIFHLKRLYYFHSIHHEYNYTFGMGAIYAHPLDFLITNLVSVSLPILIFKIPYYHSCFITIFATCYTTIISHGGYDNSLGEGHLIHHVKRTHNYGLFIFDRLLGTHTSLK